MTTAPDSLGMQEATLGLPDQIERSSTESQQFDGLPSASKIDQVVVIGMGGSGIAGDIVVHLLPEKILMNYSIV